MTTTHIVLRAAPDLPPGILDPYMDGRWFHRADLPTDLVTGSVRMAGEVVFVAVPTGRFEHDPERAPGDDLAEVFEVRP